ncbi:MAG: 4-(cytidine 5'-diphospho)-2-C-methyl-D-erythritol kinase [Gemmatimonadales bacterium]|jgi:4-diphosphocytidyl-2-C-methyl-D-erythritol kinase
MKIVAPAKLNLSLRVLGRQMDGYHVVETLLVRLHLADELELEAGGEGLRLELAGSGDGGGDPSPEDSRRHVPVDERNLCWQAARRLYEEVGRPPAVRVRLAKRIPVAAGLGGGSSDAAAVLVGLNRLLGEPLTPAEVLALAGDLGSDVAFFVADTPFALAWGRGQRVLRLPAPPSRPVLLLVPGFGVTASEAYGWWSGDQSAGEAEAAAADLVSELLPDTPAAADGSARGPRPHPAPAGVLPWPAELRRWEGIASSLGNDLQGPVERRHPELARAREALEATGAATAFLCGSGSCVAGIFADEASRDEARTRLAAAAPAGAAWRVIPTRTEGPDGA